MFCHLVLGLEETNECQNILVSQFLCLLNDPALKTLNCFYFLSGRPLYVKIVRLQFNVFDRPGVAGAVLQTPS